MAFNPYTGKLVCKPVRGPFPDGPLSELVHVQITECPETYLEQPWYRDNYLSCPNFVYTGTLEFDRAGNQVVYFKANTNRWQFPEPFLQEGPLRVRMFHSDFFAILPHMAHGTITGRFTWRKAGNRIGIYMLPQEN